MLQYWIVPNYLSLSTSELPKIHPKKLQDLNLEPGDGYIRTTIYLPTYHHHPTDRSPSPSIGSFARHTRVKNHHPGGIGALDALEGLLCSAGGGGLHRIHHALGGVQGPLQLTSDVLSDAHQEIRGNIGPLHPKLPEQAS